MPFVLVNAPAVFQHFINEVVRETLFHYTFVYLDDILNVSCALEKHEVHVWRILQLFLQHQHYGKLEKSQFHVSTDSSQRKLNMDSARE